VEIMRPLLIVGYFRRRLEFMAASENHRALSHKKNIFVVAIPKESICSVVTGECVVVGNDLG
jgi:hypothetical protein